MVTPTGERERPGGAVVTPGGEGGRSGRAVTPGGLVVLTDRRAASGALVEVVREAVRWGAAWVVLRERDLPDDERAALATRLRSVVPPGRLIVAGPDPLGGFAVHLAGADPLPGADLLPGGEVGAGSGGLARQSRLSRGEGAQFGVGSESSGRLLVGRSWHGFEDLSGVDYVTVSPVYPTLSKPGYGPALGAAGAAGMGAPVPWLALGGIDSAERAEECALAGAAGIAVMGAVMRTPSLAGELVAGFESGSTRRRGVGTDRTGPPVIGSRTDATALEEQGMTALGSRA